ncbi:Transposase [Caligus rogercresseyi]|uniref:Transposase n=1 Tax=Caligus rogercresseyi TaxID=217165 RepID=A0A7T8GQW3_CALRO|nr:Transposase [Caligus rogercresseyi]
MSEHSKRNPPLSGSALRQVFRLSESLNIYVVQNNSIPCQNIRWHTEFDKGVFALEKKTRPGRPRETRTEENVTRVKRLVEDNPRMTTRQVAAEVSLPSTTVFRLLTEDLGLRNLLSVLVPHQLSEANKTQRVKCCQDLLKLFQDHGEDFLGSHLLVQDDMGGAHGGPVLDPPCETDSEEDDDSDGDYLQTEAGVDHCTTCRDHSRPEHHDRVPEDDWKRFLSLKKDKIRLKDCLLMWDNARPHTATDTREFLTRRDVEPGKQSPYSPDLNLCDSTYSGGRVWGLYDQLRKLRGHCHDVIAVGGNYVY